MNNPPMKIRATMIALTLAGVATATIATGTANASSTPAATTAPGQVRVAGKFAAPYVTLAGSQANAIALANALRTGTPATLTYLSVAPDNVTTIPDNMTTMTPGGMTAIPDNMTTIAPGGMTTVTTVTITPPTRPMGWGNVSHSLALAQFALAQAGITNPTGAQLQAALQGGSVTTADGKTVAFAGVLQQRADGMGWGRIAQSYGTTLGAVNHGIKAPATTVAVTPTDVTPKVQPVTPARGLTTAAGTTTGANQSDKGLRTAAGTTVGANKGDKGLTTAAGTTVGANKGDKGLTTAAGGSGHAKANGIVSASGSTHGNGNAYGRGVVTAAGGGAGAVSGVNASTGGGKGVVTGTGSVGHVVSANPDHGAGSAKGNAKGKSGG